MGMMPQVTEFKLAYHEMISEQLDAILQVVYASQTSGFNTIPMDDLRLILRIRCIRPSHLSRTYVIWTS
jgi:hypothetical protein